jgi:quercetin dioxygenase-like cupin family protein
MSTNQEHDLHTPVALHTLVEYQSGSIVSRTLVKKPSGTVTLFAFAGGEGLSEHTAPYDALVELVDGKIEIEVGGETHLVSQGQVLLLPANVPHALRAQHPCKMMLTMMRS